MSSFAELGIRPELLAAIAELGFETPTPVQEQAIPRLLAGEKDLVALAQTGTGKTAAFGLPLLHHLDPGGRDTQALVLAPTRELCVQITRDLANFSKNLPGIRCVAVYGGASIREQIRAIQRGAHVIVATPGRLIDLMERGAADLSHVRIAVLDEADEMLNMGFQEDLTTILEKTPAEKRTWLFSATMSHEVRRIAKNYMRDTEELVTGRANAAAATIEHRYTVVMMRDRYLAVKRFVDATPGLFGIVFCRTKQDTQDLAEALTRDGYDADALHGDLTQFQRDRVMERYRARNLQLLIATDVAARGIDVSDVTHVIHYGLPVDSESYTHRSGRTGRAGKAGVSLSIIGGKDVHIIRDLERRLKTHFTFVRVPGGAEICEVQLLSLIRRIKDVEVDEEGIERFMDAVHLDLQDLSREELIKRVVSIEFNRFLEQYREARDLNVDMARKDHNPDARKREKKEYARGAEGPMRSLFINLGTADGFDKGRMLGYLCGITGLTGQSFGRILLKDMYAFVDVEAGLFDEVIGHFKAANYKGRKIRVDEGTGGAPARPGGERHAGPREKKPFRKERA